MSGWDREVDRDGKTVADQLVEVLWEIKDLLEEIKDRLSGGTQ